MGASKTAAYSAAVGVRQRGRSEGLLDKLSRSGKRTGRYAKPKAIQA